MPPGETADGEQGTPTEIDTGSDTDPSAETVADKSTESSAGTSDEQMPLSELAKEEPAAEKKLGDLKKAFDDWNVKEKTADGQDLTEPEDDSRKPKESEKDA